MVWVNKQAPDSLHSHGDKPDNLSNTLITGRW